jgi:hypothetical protein
MGVQLQYPPAHQYIINQAVETNLKPTTAIPFNKKSRPPDMWVAPQAAVQGQEYFYPNWKMELT